MLYILGKSFVGLFYPNLCEACGNSLVGAEQVLCTACRYNIPKTNYWETDNNPVAQSFWGRVGVDKACSYFFFNKGSNYRKLLHKLKYRGQKEIGFTLGRYFGQELKNKSWCNGIDMLVPVPLHPKNLHKRGYNQSECIAQGMAGVLELAVITGNLIKRTHTESQTQKGRLERWQNVSKVFAVINPQIFEGKHILLIDDTMTTGATLEACAQALLSSCNCKVSVATLAYAPL
ncbi:MAG: ComF family protein [Prevotellaceae bacterium]|jgi:ComF family protein|nr:ComF family protein [Prevotellaceae bacterium]